MNGSSTLILLDIDINFKIPFPAWDRGRKRPWWKPMSHQTFAIQILQQELQTDPTHNPFLWTTCFACCVIMHCVVSVHVIKCYVLSKKRPEILRGQSHAWSLILETLLSRKNENLSSWQARWASPLFVNINVTNASKFLKSATVRNMDELNDRN